MSTQQAGHPATTTVGERIEARLAELTAEYRAGEEQLRELVTREAALRETLLRISGAIQVLRELGEQPVAAAGRTAQNGAGADPGVLTVD